MSLVRLGKLRKSKMVNSIEKVAKEVVSLSEGNYQTALLYSAIAGAIVSDVIATPASTWAYYKMRKYQEQEKSGLITSKEAEKDRSSILLSHANMVGACLRIGSL
jgi:hypothetical protein